MYILVMSELFVMQSLWWTLEIGILDWGIKMTTLEDGEWIFCVYM